MTALPANPITGNTIAEVVESRLNVANLIAAVNAEIAELGEEPSERSIALRNYKMTALRNDSIDQAFRGSLNRVMGRPADAASDKQADYAADLRMAALNQIYGQMITGWKTNNPVVIARLGALIAECAAALTARQLMDGAAPAILAGLKARREEVAALKAIA
jgi:hypothetical protein